MRCISKLLLAFLVGAALASPRSPAKREDEVEAAKGSDEKFAFDAAARFNEVLLANVDALDTGLTTILAGVVAVVVFTIDKVRELQGPQQWIALGLLSGATLICIAGYLIGMPRPGLGNRDGIRPLTFLPDFVRHPQRATADAIGELAKAGEVNLAVRLSKRILAIAALTLLLAGVTVVAVARFYGKVV